MFRFSLRRMLIAVLGCAVLSAGIGVVCNQTSIVKTLFNSGEKQIQIESSRINPRGTFLQLIQGNQTLIKKRAVSVRPISPSDIVSYDFDLTGKVKAFYYDDMDPNALDMLLLVDIESDAYAVYWSGCRADKCSTFSWKVWDQRFLACEEFINSN